MIREALSLSVHALAYTRMHDWYMLAGGGIIGSIHMAVVTDSEFKYQLILWAWTLNLKLERVYSLCVHMCNKVIHLVTSVCVYVYINSLFSVLLIENLLSVFYCFLTHFILLLSS